MEKWIIVYGNYENIEKNAVENLYKTVSDYVPYSLICKSFEKVLESELSECNIIFVGTKDNNSFVKKHSKNILTKEEEYSIEVKENPYNKDKQIILISGFDSAGVLYGCVDFYAVYLMQEKNTHDHGAYFLKLFSEKMPEYSYQSAPKIKRRGTWTWGYVICDYKGYIDNMVKLKLNTLTIWNDYPPVNANEIVNYAHENNIKVFWGFPWMWDVDCKAVDFCNLENEILRINKVYDEEYAHLNGDGIYFQTFTEIKGELIGDIVIAEAATDFVNKTAKIMLENHPELELQFGLHSTSVNNKLDILFKTDPRITIVWEDCGAFPYDYIPQNVNDFEKTVEFTKRISNLRGIEEKFGVVLKGLTCLDWYSFVHQEGGFILGKRSKAYIEKRTNEKMKIWKN